MNPLVYLDYNATTPVDPEVLEEMMPFLKDSYGNAASSSHNYGWAASEAVEIARRQVADLIQARPSEIIFTSGATESINLAIKGFFEYHYAQHNHCHIISSATEHKAVLDVLTYLQTKGATVTYVPVDTFGVVDLTALEEAITEHTAMICLMYANNETGVIQPIKEISTIATAHDITFFSDGTQAIGKIPIDPCSQGIDMMAFSSHKIYGPKGVGALYVRHQTPTTEISIQTHGGGHERGFRSGTLNVPGIVGLGKACERCAQLMETEKVSVAALRDTLERGLLAIDMTLLNGHSTTRMGNVCNISFGNVDSTKLLPRLCRRIAVSSGSACTSAVVSPSHVLQAMGFSDERSFASVRFSIGRFTTAEDIHTTLQHVESVIHGLRK